VLGTAGSIDEQGRLHIDSEAGPVAVSAGDVVHLR
jgi:BirA family transcriptional regulator, biotin operon repressor / biotin---[acetyl-CoA-carboxylase] ligase